MMKRAEKNIVWLASYPKSGNTWFRVFLSNLLSESNEPVHINELKETSIASARKPFDEITGLPSADLTHEEIDMLRPEVYRFIAAEAEETVYKKVHDAFITLPGGRYMFPPEVSRAVVYFVRNPFDVAVSFAHHSARKPKQMVEVINNPGYAFCSKRTKLYNQLRQQLGDWSFHVKSWTEQKEIPVLTLQYEAMKREPFEHFKRATGFLGLQKTDEEISKALENSRLDILQEQEKENGFKEKSIKAESFFRKGAVGEWKDVFTRQEVEKITAQHREVLKHFGYLTDKNEVVTGIK
ncbi:MAG: sulfotransferase domain-containing protein [Bacteroidales bacterium]